MGVFFFQAEDGIRDIGVTGVQTCALPISTTSRGVFSARRARAFARATSPSRSRQPRWISSVASASEAAALCAKELDGRRSEERRVGKEWEARGVRKQ